MKKDFRKGYIDSEGDRRSMATSKDLPAIVESMQDVESYAAQGAFKEILNQAPAKSWVKDHPFANATRPIVNR